MLTDVSKTGALKNQNSLKLGIHFHHLKNKLYAYSSFRVTERLGR
jgi:hypothetical protein